MPDWKALSRKDVAMPEKLTVLIPCKDEEKNIRACIESVKDIADELLVADSGSSDSTTDIARECGARIIEREYINPADFKNWAIPQAAHPWVFRLDADERVTPELAAEVRKTLAGTPNCDGYWVRRRSYFLGHEIRHSGWGSDRIIGLFRREGSRYAPVRVHEEVVVESGRVGRLKCLIRHYTYWSVDQWAEKADRYTTWAAQDLRDRGRRAGLASLLFRPAFRFFRHYVLKLGFLDGKPGLLVSLLSAYSVFLKYAKLWQMQKGLPQPDPEADTRRSAAD
jgi:glycosyltransferase involved in cell wall biosynthesis